MGEQTTKPTESELEFMLPGENLEMALGALGRLDARVVSTTIDVDAEQIERTTTTDSDGKTEDSTDGQVRLRVEVTEASPTGAGAVLRLVMALFSVIGIVATVMWVLNWWRRRGEPDAPKRQIERFDLRDPPTQETPRVPPQW